MQKVNKQLGITLLELLLVVAVLAAMSVAGISYLRDRALNSKIDKTVLQMQMWMQAAIAYRNENPTWPQAEDMSSMMPKYMPVNSDRSVWYEADAPQLGVYQFIDTGPESSWTQLTLTLPDTTAGVNAKTIAARIAGKLPVASVDEATATVTATVNMPTPPGHLPGFDTVLKVIPGEFKRGKAYVKSDPNSKTYDLALTSYIEALKAKLAGTNICNSPQVVKTYLQLTSFLIPTIWLIPKEEGKDTPVMIRGISIIQAEDAEVDEPFLKVNFKPSIPELIRQETVDQGAFMATIVCAASE